MQLCLCLRWGAGLANRQVFFTERGEAMAQEETKKLNAEIPAALKKRLDVYCSVNDCFIYHVVTQALKEYLDRKNAPNS